MILDNADDEKTFFELKSDVHITEADQKQPLAGYLPQSTNGSILVTSRNKNVAYRITGSTDQIITIPPLNEEDSCSLLLRKLPRTFSMDNVMKDLVKTLDYLPLAITQAAAYISMRNGMTVSKCIEIFHQNEKLLLLDMGDLRRDSTVPHAILLTWQISFDQIKKTHSQAAEMLSLMSVLDRQGIPDFLLDKGDLLSFTEAIAPLHDFSLITVEAGGDFYGMHRLVQLATRTWLEFHQEIKR